MIQTAVLSLPVWQFVDRAWTAILFVTARYVTQSLVAEFPFYNKELQ